MKMPVTRQGCRAVVLLLMLAGLIAGLHAEPAPPARFADVADFAARASAMPGPGPGTVTELARGFLGTPYLKGRLQGPKDPATGLVMSTSKVDCMIMLEWLLAGNAIAGRPEAGRQDSLARALLDVRFRHGRNRVTERHHFFSDWLDSGPRLRDAGRDFTGAQACVVDLNRRADDRRWVQGVPCRKTEVWHVPATRETLDSLRTGDLIGLWAAKPGLDVTHVGVVVREHGQAMLLNASSRAMKVRLEPLEEHPAWPKGLLVFRLPEAQ